MGFNFKEWIISTDMFGSPVVVNYKGSDVYQTKLGAFFSLATYALMIINLVSLLQDFFNNSRQSESQQTKKFDTYFGESYSLQENLFGISLISIGRLPEKFGRFRLT